ncbi:hypothetical protein [Humibacter ginsenosidimutans]|nr:hypothetical protein [Humibacter ginsenosidimutans]
MTATRDVAALLRNRRLMLAMEAVALIVTSTAMASMRGEFLHE